MKRVVEHISEDDGNVDLQKLFIELFENNIDIEKIYKMIKGTD